MRRLVLCFFTAYFLQVTLGEPRRELLYVTALWRHGQRASATGQITPADALVFKNGIGMLTDEGVAKSRELGAFLKKEYIEKHRFLPREFDKKTISFRSVAIPRCIATAKNLFSGLYDSCKQEVDVFSLDKRDMDWLLKFQWKDCPALGEHFGKTCENYPDITNLTYLEFEDQSFRCSNASDVTKFFKDHKYYEEAERLIAREHAGANMDKDYTGERAVDARKVTSHTLNYQLGGAPFRDPFILKVNSGLLANTLHTDIQKKWDCYIGKELKDCDSVLFKGFSTQDFVINVQLDILSGDAKLFAVGDQMYPSYNAFLGYELWIEGDQPKIRVVYKRGTYANEFVILTPLIPACEQQEFCDLDKFKESAKDIITTDPAKDCNYQPKP